MSTVLSPDKLSQETLWNLPIEPGPTNRLPLVRDLLKLHFGERSLRVLEIGVYTAGLIKVLSEGGVKLSGYVGVDPYLGTADDPYTGGYWKDTSGSQDVYQGARERFDRYHGKLLRMTSEQFIKEEASKEAPFDVVFIDGDHRFESCLADLRWFWPMTKPAGLMMMDDYANVDHPGVTKAINRFITEKSNEIGRMGYKVVPFVNKSKHVPAINTLVYVERRPENT
jgi:hypothetical protein